MTERSRCDKRCYESEHSASRKLSEIRSKRGHRAQRVEERAYHCDKCGWWHLTSKPLAYPSLDRLPDTAITRPHKRSNAAHRRFRHPINPIGNYTASTDMASLAENIQRIIHHRRIKSQRGSVMLGNLVGEVFLLPDQEPFYQRFIDAHPTWRIGSYAMRTPPVFPTLQDILDDLLCHYADLETVDGRQKI